MVDGVTRKTEHSRWGRNRGGWARYEDARLRVHAEHVDDMTFPRQRDEGCAPVIDIRDADSRLRLS